VIQVADIVLPAFNATDSVLQTLIIACIVAFPLFVHGQGDFFDPGCRGNSDRAWFGKGTHAGLLACNC
jgi:hypothetical protein